MNTKEGDNAELYCDYETSTESEVTWLKGDEKIYAGPQHEQTKYTLVNSSKSSHKNTSILVVNRVIERDLGSYLCIVKNGLGSENVTIELTNLPEPPHLHHMEQEGDSVITHWHIRSLQPLTEVVLNYRQKDVSFHL